MGRKKASKISAKQSPKAKAEPKFLSGVGEEAIPLLPPRLEMERFSRAVGKLLEAQEFDDPEEINVFLNKAIRGGTFENIVDMTESDPEEEAQDLAYEAMQAGSVTKSRSLIRKALKIDPHCLDAQVMQAELDAHSDRELLDAMRTIVRGAEIHFGEEFMRENKGHFWGLVETRPYMRARGKLASLFQQCGDHEGAIVESEGLLELNPSDNQGVRDTLHGMYLEKGDVEGVRRLNKQYDDSTFAVPAWSAVLERWLSDDLKQAEKLARSAHKSNRYVIRYLSGEKRLPKNPPDYYSPGSEEEGILCAFLLGGAWRANPEAKIWLLKLNLK